MVDPVSLRHLGRAFAHAERAFGIRAVGCIINEAGVDLKLVADLDPQIHGLRRRPGSTDSFAKAD